MIAFSFDPTLTVGNVVESVAVVTGGVMALTRLVGSIRVVGESVKRVEEKSAIYSGRLDRIEAELAKQTEILVSIARFEARLSNVESEMNGLRRLKDA